MDDCTVCRIVAGELPASVVFRSARCTAFMDVRPANPGHVLVVPNDHAASLKDLPTRDGAAMFRAAQEVTAALYRSGLRCEGVNLSLADGEFAGQEIPHVHLHVIPRFEEDGVDLTFGSGYENRPHRTALDRTADRLKEAL